MAQGFLGLKLFREEVTQFTQAKDMARVKDLDISLPNELSLLEARKFLDELGITKKLNEYRRVSTVLGGKVKTLADGKLADDGSAVGYGKDSADFYIEIHNKSLNYAREYLARVNDLLATGMTYKDAQRHARSQYEKLIDNDIRIAESSHPISAYFDQVKRKLEIK